MSDIEQTKQRLELLKMARTLLNEEYINRRAEDHNKWLAECDESWRTRRIKLPYPPFAPYPSEAEIVAKALTLYNFVNPDSAKPPAAEAEGGLTKREVAAISEITKNKTEVTYTPSPIDSRWQTYLATGIETPEATVTPVASIAPVAPIAPVMPVMPIPTSMVEPAVVVPEPTVAAAPVVKEPDDVNESTFSASVKNMIPNFWRQRETNGDK
jgi:hypothetical protein